MTATAGPQDDTYRTRRHRCVRSLLWAHHKVHFLPSPDLITVDAAFCPWQRTLWVVPGLEEADLALIFVDISVYLSTYDLTDLQILEDSASQTVRRLTSPTVVVAPRKRRLTVVPLP